MCIYYKNLRHIDIYTLTFARGTACMSHIAVMIFRVSNSTYVTHKKVCFYVDKIFFIIGLINPEITQYNLTKFTCL